MTRYRDDRRDDRYDDRYDMRDDRRSGDMRDRDGAYRDDRREGERYLYADRSGMGQGYDRGNDRGYDQRQGYGQQGYGRDDQNYGMNRDQGGMGQGMSGGYRDDGRSSGMSGQGGSQAYGGSVRAYRSDYEQRQQGQGYGGMEGGRQGQQRPYPANAWTAMDYGQDQGRGMGRQYQSNQSQGDQYQSGRYQGDQYPHDSRMVYGADVDTGNSSNYRQGQMYGQGQGYDSSGMGMGMGGGGMVSHRGKGPRGYQRSDDRLREMVSEALEDEHGVDASEIEVQVQNGEVTLTGTVNDRQQKRRAEDCAEQVRGVRDVHNQLRVQQGSGMSRTGAGGVAGTTDMGPTGTTVNRTGDNGVSSTGETPMGSLGSGASDNTRR